MNLRQFSIALLISAFPTFVFADTPVSFNKGDFVSANSKSRNGEMILSVKLSKSGKAKVKKLNQDFVGKSIHVEIAGIASDLKLREQIKGDSLEMGPYSGEDAQKIATEIGQE